MMISQNEEIFKKFRIVHDAYAIKPDENREEFNSIGRDLQDIIRDWENRLCSQSEKSSYGKFSANLSDKFWDEIRKDFPLIDQIGLLT